MAAAGTTVFADEGAICCLVRDALQLALVAEEGPAQCWKALELNSEQPEVEVCKRLAVQAFRHF